MPLILVYRETFVSFAYVVNLWSCWNSGYELDIVATTRSNRVFQSFSFSLSLSTELLEDKQGFKLGGVDTSPSYLLFQTLLPLFWTLICMIWMELTRTNAVFSRIAMVLFLCRNKSSRNVLKIYGDFFWNKRKIPAHRSAGGGVLVGHKPTGRDHPPRPRRAGLWGPRGTIAPNLSSISSVSPRKIEREGFIAFCDTEAPPPPVLHLEGRSGVRFGLRRGEIVAIVIINLLPSPIPWSSSSFVSNLFVGSLGGDE